MNVDEVGVVERFDARFENLSRDEFANFGGDGGGSGENEDGGSEDARDEAAGAAVMHAEGVGTEEDDGFEDDGGFEDEVP